MILVAQRGEYVGKLIVLSLDESEKIIYDKIMKIVGESDICVDKTLLKEQEPMRIGELYIQSEQHKVLKRDQEVRLTNIEFRILYVLALHQGMIGCRPRKNFWKDIRSRARLCRKSTSMMFRGSSTHWFRMGIRRLRSRRNTPC